MLGYHAGYQVPGSRSATRWRGYRSVRDSRYVATVTPVASCLPPMASKDNPILDGALVRLAEDLPDCEVTPGWASDLLQRAVSRQAIGRWCRESYPTDRRLASRVDLHETRQIRLADLAEWAGRYMRGEITRAEPSVRSLLRAVLTSTGRRPGVVYRAMEIRIRRQSESV